MARKRNKAVDVRVVFDRKHLATKATAKNRKLGLVQIEVYYDAKRVYYSTGVKVYSDQFRNGRVYNHGQQGAYNERIKLFTDTIENYVNDTLKREGRFDMDRFKSFMQNSLSKFDSKAPFLDFIERMIAERDVSPRTKKGHYETLGLLRKWGVIRHFEDITVDNVMLWHKESVKAAVKGAFAVNRDRMLRIYIRLAYKMHLIQHNPYDEWNIPVYTPIDTHRYITLEDVDKIRHLELENKNDIMARDLFLFQCNTGLSFIDTQDFDDTGLLKSGGRMSYHDKRIKTAKRFYVPLSEEARDILKRYGGEPPKMPPRTYNTHIGIVGKLAGLKVTLTSHWARHTFAMICLNNGMSIEVLAKILGHAKITTTQIYGKMLEKTVDREFDRVMEKLKGK